MIPSEICHSLAYETWPSHSEKLTIRPKLPIAKIYPNFLGSQFVGNGIPAILIDTLHNEGRLFSGQEFILVREVHDPKPAQHTQEEGDGTLDYLAQGFRDVEKRR